MADGIICEFGKGTRAFKNGDTFTVSRADYYRHVYGYSFCFHSDGYVQYSGSKDGLHKKLLHRVIMNVTDPNIYIDHINHNPTDNRRENLRLCTNRENSQNASLSKSNSSGLKGVDFRKKTNKFRARIGINGKHKFLGYYDTKEEAFACYQKASIELFGDFAFDGIEKPPEILNLVHESELDSAETRVKTFFHRNTYTTFDKNPKPNPDHEKFIRDWVEKNGDLHTGQVVL